MADDPTPPEPQSPPAAGIRAVLDAWGQVLAPVAAAGRDKVDPKDRRFAGPEWEHPVFDLMRQNYATMAEAMMKSVDQAPGLDDAARDRARFAMRALVAAMRPSNTTRRPRRSRRPRWRSSRRGSTASTSSISAPRRASSAGRSIRA